MSFLVTEKDRLSLITFETEVELVFNLINMTDEKKSDALMKIKDIHTKNCTNLSGGLFKGIDEIANRNVDGKNEVSSILLFTDGVANRGMDSYLNNNTIHMPICMHMISVSVYRVPYTFPSHTLMPPTLPTPTNNDNARKCWLILFFVWSDILSYFPGGY